MARRKSRIPGVTGPAPAPRRSLDEILGEMGLDAESVADEAPDVLPTDDYDTDALAELIASNQEHLEAVAQAHPRESLLAAQIDADLGNRIWNGTTAPERLGRIDGVLTRSLYDEIEKSLFAQESYDDFEGRMLGKLGVTSVEPRTGGRAMVAMDQALENEARLGWNEGLIAANDQEDTVLVWAAILDDRTTPGCWDNHGRTQEEIGDDQGIPAHERCRCRWLVVPNPESEDAEWARMGREILDEMADERDSGDAAPMKEVAHARALTRFRVLRECVALP